MNTNSSISRGASLREASPKITRKRKKCSYKIFIKSKIWSNSRPLLIGTIIPHRRSSRIISSLANKNIWITKIIIIFNLKGIWSGRRPLLDSSQTKSMKILKKNNTILALNPINLATARDWSKENKRKHRLIMMMPSSFKQKIGNIYSLKAQSPRGRPLVKFLKDIW